MVKVKAKGYIDKIQNTSPEVENVQYHVHLQYLIKQKKHVYIEEEIEFRQAEFYKGVLVEDKEINPLMFDDNQVIDKNHLRTLLKMRKGLAINIIV